MRLCLLFKCPDVLLNAIREYIGARRIFSRGGKVREVLNNDLKSIL